jgi:hypothetical protein
MSNSSVRQKPFREKLDPERTMWDSTRINDLTFSQLDHISY